MSFIVGNPLGLLALLGIPAVLIVHWLQQASRTERVSTLFLLPRGEAVQHAGLRLTQLKNSLMLWLQLFIVLLLSWLLLSPRWLRQDSTQTVVVVLDSSQSMQAFREKAQENLRNRLREISSNAVRTDWVILESHRSRRTLYSGNSFSGVQDALTRWHPDLGGHQSDGVLSVALHLAGAEGRTIFVTDHSPAVSAGVELLAVGSVIENVGFSGLKVGEVDGVVSWSALIKNFGKETANREWWIDLAGKQEERHAIELPPRGVKIIRGSFPPGRERFALRLSEDQFALDDSFPIVLPQIKSLRLYVDQKTGFTPAAARLAEATPHILLARSWEEADVQVVESSDLRPARTSIRFGPALEKWRGSREYVVNEYHPLVDGLNWSGFLGVPSEKATTTEKIEPLVWQGDRTLISLKRGVKPRLHFHFAYDQSNAGRMPAFVVLLYRFLEYVRSVVPLRDAQPERRNFELRQSFQIPVKNTTEPVRLLDSDDSLLIEQVPTGGVALLRAPGTPGYFRVQQGEKVLLSGAAHFADIQESNFMNAASGVVRLASDGEVRMKNTYADPTVPLWLLAIGLLCTWTWLLRPGRLR